MICFCLWGNIWTQPNSRRCWPLEIQEADIFQPTKFNYQNSTFHRNHRAMPCPTPTKAYHANGEMQRIRMGQKTIVKSKSLRMSPIVMIPKRDKNTWDCVDFWRVKAITQADPYPTCRTEDLQDLVRCKIHKYSGFGLWILPNPLGCWYPRKGIFHSGMWPVWI